MLPFSLCNKKSLAIWHTNRPPLSNDTIDSVLRHPEVGRAKDLPAPPRTRVKAWITGGLRVYLGIPTGFIQSKKKRKKNSSNCNIIVIIIVIYHFYAGYLQYT